MAFCIPLQAFSIDLLDFSLAWSNPTTTSQHPPAYNRRSTTSAGPTQAQGQWQLLPPEDRQSSFLNLLSSYIPTSASSSHISKKEWKTRLTSFKSAIKSALALEAPQSDVLFESTIIFCNQLDVLTTQLQHEIQITAKELERCWAEWGCGGFYFSPAPEFLYDQGYKAELAKWKALARLKQIGDLELVVLKFARNHWELDGPSQARYKDLKRMRWRPGWKPVLLNPRDLQREAEREAEIEARAGGAVGCAVASGIRIARQEVGDEAPPPYRECQASQDSASTPMPPRADQLPEQTTKKEEKKTCKRCRHLNSLSLLSNFRLLWDIFRTPRHEVDCVVAVCA